MTIQVDELETPKTNKSSPSKSSPYSSASPMVLTPSTHSRGLSGAMGRKVLEGMYPAPFGEKHGVMGSKIYGRIQNKSSIEPAAKRGINQFRRIQKTANFGGTIHTEEEQIVITNSDRARLDMMSNYFAQKIDEYKEKIDKCMVNMFCYNISCVCCCWWGIH